MTLLRLNTGLGVAYRYHMAINPHDDSLYISDPESHQILRLKNSINPTDIDNNWERGIGNGIRCLPGDLDSCGDGGHAKEARLSYPKGLAISSDNIIYFADGTDIRMVDQDGIISTIVGGLVGQNSQQRSWQPLACKGTIGVRNVALRWPTDLAINPLDNTLHFIDDSIVMKLTTDEQIEIIAGRPLHCSRSSESTEQDYIKFAAQTTLVSPQAISFSAQGDMFLAESDSRRVNRISMVSTDGRIHHFAGKDSKCNCQDKDCPCFDKNKLLATDSIFGSIRSIATSPDGNLYIADQANRRIRMVKTSIPGLTKNQEYEMYSPENQEVYIFNRFGLHIETRNIPSKKTIYRFSYTVSTSNGKLTTISDASGSKIKIARDYAGQATAMENTIRQNILLKLDRKRKLIKMTHPDNSSISFSYTRSSELIHTRHGSDKSFFSYDYDSYGRLENVITSTGDNLALVSELEKRGTVVNITLNKQDKILSILMQPNVVYEHMGDKRGQSIMLDSDRSFTMNTDWGHKYSIETSPYPILSDRSMIGTAESFPVPYRERTNIGRDAVNRFEWQYFTSGSSNKNSDRVGKKLKVSGEHLLTIELNRQTDSQLLRLERTQAMLNVTNSIDSLRISMLPSGLFATMILEKNQLGMPTSWRWGDMRAEIRYDGSSRVKEVRTFPDSITKYERS